MARVESPEPPAKRQRLSGEFAADAEHPLASSPPSNTPVPERFFPDPSQPGLPVKPEPPFSAKSSPLPALVPPNLGTDESDATSRPTPLKSEPPAGVQESSVPFDEELFESFIGHKVEPDIKNIIRDACRGDLERAVNMYFDGTWKKLKKSTRAPVSQATTSISQKQPKLEPETEPLPERSRFQPRYIGAFGVEGWATRSGSNLLKHGDVVKIERQKIQRPQATAKGQMKLGMPVVTPRMTAAAARRVDVLVRFTTQAGSEVGRLSKEAANWVSTLIDQKIARFEGTCVYAPDRLRTNDTVFLQLKAYLLPSAFHAQVLQPTDDIATSFREEDETLQEKELRLRQVALTRLFQEINLFPTTLNAAAAKEQRQGLLDAAEMDEKQAKEPPKTNGRFVAPCLSCFSGF